MTPPGHLAGHNFDPVLLGVQWDWRTEEGEKERGCSLAPLDRKKIYFPKMPCSGSDRRTRIPGFAKISLEILTKIFKVGLYFLKFVKIYMV